MLSAIKRFLRKHGKYAPIVFFVTGFIWDSLTLTRIDDWYSNTVLFTHMSCLTICIYIFNLADDGRWNDTFLEPYEEYAPLLIQFFLGGLSSAYVIFFFQSVSFTKTMVFFMILVGLFISNEFLKNRISNKYLQFGAYFFVNFTFCTFFLPVLIGKMNTTLFVISGLFSLVFTFSFIFYLYWISPSTRKEITGWKISILIISIYLFINACYYFNLIPPVPLSLQSGIVAYNINKKDRAFRVTYEQTSLFRFWKTYNNTFHYTKGDTVFVYASIFAPTDLKKSIEHQWKWYDDSTKTWNVTDNIAYKVIGGRRGGYRGYTFKENIWPGRWRVSVRTNDGLVLGRIDFHIIPDSTFDKRRLLTRNFN
ncbi:MAG TPA: DUF2914 domain-containing protein [Balneolaceae bacterium]|nr:DUF2914 domain-containing protein [Balneolaceae bacterium]